jgi:hypothetical protein
MNELPSTDSAQLIPPSLTMVLSTPFQERGARRIFEKI